MRRPLLLTAGLAVLSVAALAQAHIPTRYAGSFPSDGIRKNITGTFTGKRLTLKFEVGRNILRNGSYSCTAISATQTRCPGTFGGSDGKSGDHVVTVTWGGGRPVATAFSK
jgi:hypothetical protein